jgi:hypothetical protein
MASAKARSKQTAVSEAEKFVTIREAGEIVRKSEASIRRDLTNGVLKRYKQGGRTLIAVSNLLGTIREA